MTESTLMTAEDHAALTAELETLEGDGRRAMAARIKTAREWGDLKENSEYHDAKNDQAHLETKIALLRDRLSRAKIVEAEHEKGVVAFGSAVRVRDEEGREQRFEIVSQQAADPASGKISVESPVARALIGVAVGREALVTLPRGTRRYTVLSVE
ncbi:MAG TPA: transcription elongation factor GreA [Solirubrobacteraceae bacterium]|jgi:transcription elongation factor GreA|nr:transcription elongation factor GreA [Solirubrobacteraceae bacterium]